MSPFCSIDTYISNFDLFALPFYFKVKGKDKLGTGAGLILTIITMAIGIGAFIYQLQQLSEGKHPNITQSTSKFMGVRSYEIPANSYQNAVGMVDKDFNPILNTVGKTYYEVFYDFCDENSCNRVGSQHCTDDFIKFHLEEFGMDQMMFKYAYCMNQTYYENNKIQLEGGSFSLSYKRMNIVVERCVNKTNQDFICASTEEQEEKLKGSVIVYGVQNFEFDQNNYENPFKEIYKMNIQFINSNDPKEQLLIYQISTVISETNIYFFFPQEKQVENLEMYGVILERSIYTPNVIGRMVVMLHENGITRTRTYQNIFNLLGTLGGFMDIVMIVCKVLVIPFNWLEQRLYLINYIYKSDLSIIDLAKSQKSRKKFRSNLDQMMKHLEMRYMLYFLQEGSQRLKLSNSSNSSQRSHINSNFTMKTLSDKNFSNVQRVDSIYDIPDEQNYKRNKIIVTKIMN